MSLGKDFWEMQDLLDAATTILSAYQKLKDQGILTEDPGFQVDGIKELELEGGGYLRCLVLYDPMGLMTPEIEAELVRVTGFGIIVEPPEKEAK